MPAPRSSCAMRRIVLPRGQPTTPSPRAASAIASGADGQEEEITSAQRITSRTSMEDAQAPDDSDDEPSSDTTSTSSKRKRSESEGYDKGGYESSVFELGPNEVEPGSEELKAWYCYNEDNKMRRMIGLRVTPDQRRQAQEDAVQVLESGYALREVLSHKILKERTQKLFALTLHAEMEWREKPDPGAPGNMKAMRHANKTYIQSLDRSVDRKERAMSRIARAQKEVEDAKWTQEELKKDVWDFKKDHDLVQTSNRGEATGSSGTMTVIGGKR